MLEDSCKGNPDKCLSGGITVEGDILTWSLSPGRRSLRQSGLSVNVGLRVTASSKKNTEEIIRKIEDNPTLNGLGSIAEAGDMKPQVRDLCMLIKNAFVSAVFISHLVSSFLSVLPAPDLTVACNQN